LTPSHIFGRSPVIAVLYLFIAARFFMVAVDRRKPIVFGMVFLAALVATSANYLSFRAYLDWKSENSSCAKQTASGQPALDLVAESALKEIARDIEQHVKASNTESWSYDVSVRAEGRNLIYTYHSKKPIVDLEAFYRATSLHQKQVLEDYCSGDKDFVRDIARAIISQTYYGSNGERLTGFSIGPADCSRPSFGAP